MRDVVEGVRPGGERERGLLPAEPGLWQQVVEQLGAAVTVIDPAGRIVAVNPAAERLLGRPAAALYGQGLHDLCHRAPGGARILRERCPLLRALAGNAAHRSAAGGLPQPTWLPREVKRAVYVPAGEPGPRLDRPRGASEGVIRRRRLAMGAPDCG
ncbi:PAS domain-containing protein [Streptomyces sp. NPDC001851]|uniref:PAS domain-containing protein n=1 Tax=Streptomyces sp. NPDC001851 TaxID=3154529 RepID=UPI003316DEA8